MPARIRGGQHQGRRSSAAAASRLGQRSTARRPAAISSADALARSATACRQSSSVQSGCAARISANVDCASRRAAVTPATTASASAAQSTLCATGQFLQHQGLDLRAAVEQGQGDGGRRSCDRPPDRPADQPARTAASPAATSGVRASPARGLAPWAGRSGAFTRQPASASAGPTRHHVADEDVDPCSSRARRSAAPQDRQRRNPGTADMQQVCARRRGLDVSWPPGPGQAPQHCAPDSRRPRAPTSGDHLAGA